MECKQAAIEQSLKLAGCYALTTDVTPAKLDAEQVHTSYMALEKVERDFRAIKTGLLEARPIFVRKEGRTRGHVFCCMLALKLAREMERRLCAAFGTTETNPDAITLPDALAGGGPGVPAALAGGGRKHRDQTAPARPEPARNSGGTRHPPASDVVRHSLPPRERQLISPINHLSAVLRPFPAGRSVGGADRPSFTVRELLA